MRFRVIVAAAALLASCVTPASALMVISGDRGGQIGHYLHTFALIRSTGEQVVIDGYCLSACTLVLGLVPRHRICATPRARLGFHAAWMPDAEGRPVTSAMGTQALMNIYPASVRRWIYRNGGLSRRMIFLQGRELARIVPSCNTSAQRYRAPSSARYSRQPVRDYGASASGYRR